MQGIIDLHKLLDWRYLSTDPSSTFYYDKPMLFILISMLLICIPLYFLSRRKITTIPTNRRIFQNVGIASFLLSLAGFFLLVSREQGLPFFDLRIMLIIWMVLCILSLLVLGAYLLLKYSKDLNKYHTSELRKQYLPRKK